MYVVLIIIITIAINVRFYYIRMMFRKGGLCIHSNAKIITQRG